jgi:predicted TIM-barrel fold metal-dependent hydrolase
MMETMAIDFHCHITTPDSRVPDPDGQYYRPILPVTPAGNLLGMWTQDALDSISERWRNAMALKAYRNLGPLIYTEMSRRMTTTDASALLGEMAAHSITRAVVVAIDPFVPTDGILEACRRLHGVLIPFGSVDTSRDDYLDVLDRVLALPIAGLKFHSDLQCLPVGSPKMHAMMERLAASERAGLPVYLHTGNFPIYRPQQMPWEDALPRLVSAFPQINFVCGHAGWDKPRVALRVALRCPNLYIETSWQPPELIRRLCDKIGPQRMLFGSDYPLYSQLRAIKNVRAALNDEEYALVTETNAERLLSLSPAAV